MSLALKSVLLGAALLAAGAGAADAQSLGGWSSSTMWGTASGSVGSGSTDTTQALLNETQIADMVTLARKGIYAMPGSTIYIQSIGSQSIVSNSIVGNGNTVAINATQTTTNSNSPVTNNGSIGSK